MSCNLILWAEAFSVNPRQFNSLRSPYNLLVMFDDLYDALSRLWSWSWPRAEGKVTEVLGEHIEFRSGEKRARLAVAYEFTIGEDGPYTGEFFWTPIFFSIRRVAEARRKIRSHQRVRIRYRPDDPSINTIEKGVAGLLKKSTRNNQSAPPIPQ